MNSKIWLSSPHMSGNELKYVNEAFETNWVAPLGPNVNAFENELAQYLGIKNCAALVSGTAAIHLALILLSVNQGDEVICQSFTFSATANPIIYQGATPVFVDSESETWNMDPELLEKAIKERLRKGKKPKAIIVVHLYGMPAKMDEIMSIAERYEIPIIEDAAEALGSKYKDKFCGTFGCMGILSFNGNKIITTSGGGALISNNNDFIQKARFLATQARDNAPHYQHSHIGYNYRMSNVVAGIGRGQLEVLNLRIEQRRANNKFYREMLDGKRGITFHTETTNRFSNYWLTSIIIEPEITGITREDLRLGLEADNIESRPLWKPMHLQPVFSGAPAYTNGFSEHAFENGLCLPSGSNLTNDDKRRIANQIRKILKWN
ncbi:DegT/DnrJ/EryC1/StrS family aminotransferase [Tenuifilum thalassicum]|uniref:GDP-perosamine synthase n=1 Tax=Tenuifilum thalassicum TaxID=2590900 RepID=A0A7D4CH27_9BACT|nr:aminotransferase class I/II-fold pyridoxal phosphate-dependent enzyme [Tenuifilum thalassicum]QKG80226.1 aminotransferase class I/II-fold pyridoxal phosphate-dependent enzyme [Tenuifilum thalassicum]